MNNEAQINGDGNIIVQNVDGSTIIINPNNADELKQLIVDLGNKIGQLPQDVLQMINEKQDLQKPLDKGANLYLSTLLHLNTHDYVFRKIMFGVTITNLTKEIRYFNQPFFKVNPAFELEPGLRHDTFALLNEVNNTQFPCRLEYDQPVSVAYPINPNSIPNYERIFSEDKDAYIQCFSTTTVGEIYESNRYEMSKFFENLKAIRR